MLLSTASGCRAVPCSLPSPASDGFAGVLRVQLLDAVDASVAISRWQKGTTSRTSGQTPAGDTQQQQQLQDAIVASLLAVSGAQLVLDQSAAPVPELNAVLHGQRWAAEPDLHLE